MTQHQAEVPQAWPKMHKAPSPAPIPSGSPPFAWPTHMATKSKSASCPPPRDPAAPQRRSIIHEKWNGYDFFRAHQAAFVPTGITTARSQAEASRSSRTLNSSRRSRSLRRGSSSSSASPSRSRSFSRSYSEGTKDDNYRCRDPLWDSKDLEADGQPLWTPKMKDMWRKAQKQRRKREKAGLSPYPSPPRDHQRRYVLSSSESPPPTCSILRGRKVSPATSSPWL